MLEEVNDIDVPMEPLHYPVVATVADPLPPMAAMSAEGQICAADGVVDTEIDGLLQASEQSITRFVRATQKPQHGLEGMNLFSCAV